jgi:hypothetical protein
LVCGADYIIFILDLCLSVCFVSPPPLLGWFCCVLGSYFIINDLVYFIDQNIVMLNGMMSTKNFIRLDFKLSHCSECCILSFGLFSRHTKFRHLEITLTKEYKFIRIMAGVKPVQNFSHISTFCQLLMNVYFRN